jgi:hypothetical protein
MGALKEWQDRALGHFSPWKKLIEQLITRFAIEQLQRLQFLFNNN